jgi:FkbM family methyltransferase
LPRGDTWRDGPVGNTVRAMPAESQFRAALFERLLIAAADNVTGVGDREWSVASEWSNSGRARARDVAARLGLRRVRFDVQSAAERLDALLSLSDGLEQTWELLEDPLSRRVMIDVLARRVLGVYHVDLPVSPKQFQAIWQKMRARRVGTETIAGPAGLRLSLLEYRGIRLWADPFQLVAFELGQYEDAQPGEVVVDGGAGFGETALMFAQQVGPKGHVVAVELDGDNRAVIERNLALNPGVAKRITVAAGALWETTGDEIEYAPFGGMSSVFGTGGTARTLTIDDLGVEGVGRIKLDVEGAEAQTLRGAQRTIARDRPRLAVAAYHREDDLAVLPALIHDIEPSYRFRLGHFTPDLTETILSSR